MAGKVTISEVPNQFQDLIKGSKFEGKTEEQVKNALYSQALQSLRNEHLAEFQALVETAFSAYGLTYRKRLSEEERAAQQVAALLAAHPNLASQFAQVEVQTLVPEGPAV